MPRFLNRAIIDEVIAVSDEPWPHKLAAKKAVGGHIVGAALKAALGCPKGKTKAKT